jgi:hypothetical protein
MWRSSLIGSSVGRLIALSVSSLINHFVIDERSETT